MKTGIELIAAERERQITAEGWTTEHDDEHDNMEIGEAARCYLDHYMSGNDSEFPTLHPRWPWQPEWWKPSTDSIRDLTKVGALIAAEIDRIQRMSEAPGEVWPSESNGGPERDLIGVISLK